MLDPRRLRSLVAVEHHGTVTAAARALGYSPSAVSQQLATLEGEVGTPLLEPDGRRVTPTAAGRALLAAAPAVFEALERATTAARSAAEVADGTVRLGALGTTIVDLVPLAAARLVAEDRGLDLVVVDLGDDVLASLRRRGVDLAVDHQWSNVEPADLQGLVATPLCEEPVFVVAHEDVDLTDPTVRRTGRWIAHPCAQCGAAGRRVVAGLGDTDPDMPITTSDSTVMLHMAALGAAMVVAPGLACLHLPAGVRAWRVPDVTRTIAAYSRAASTDDPRLVTLRGHLVAAGSAVQERCDAVAAAACELPPA